MKGTWRAYFELLRLPAVFTAMADVMMGFLVTHGDLSPALQSGLLVAASALMYLAGLVLNDAFVVDIDVVERPQRPIPSGRISLASARRLGWSLFIGGCFVAWLVAVLSHAARPAIVGSLLAGCILLYDAVLKRTPIGPLLMGLCRFFNVLLGMSLAIASGSYVLCGWTISQLAVAAGIGIYVAGITIFARTEERQSAPLNLASAILVMLGGIAMMGSGAIGLGNPSHYRWMVWLVIGTYVALRHSLVLTSGDSIAVLRSVRSALRMLIFLDFVIAFEAAPRSAGCVLILLLLVPMLALEYWFSTT